jgi:hypothetical protein
MFGPKEENFANNSCFESKTEWYQEFRTFKVKKIADFNEEQAEIISARIIQKNYHPIRQSLKRWYHGRRKNGLRRFSK